jgi:hypothetical protein
MAQVVKHRALGSIPSTAEGRKDRREGRRKERREGRIRGREGGRKEKNLSLLTNNMIVNIKFTREFIHEL